MSPGINTSEVSPYDILSLQSEPISWFYKRPTPSHTPAKFCVSIGNAKYHESFETAKSFARFWWSYQIWTKLLGKYTPSHKDIQGLKKCGSFGQNGQNATNSIQN